MGTWALDFNPGATGIMYEFVWFNGNLFSFGYTGTGDGVWRRDGPGAWTNTINGGASSGRGAVWDDSMWFTVGQQVNVSSDGTNWTVDHDFGPGAYSHWSALGGYSSYLRMAMAGFQGAAGTQFMRRDTAGNYVQTPVDNTEASHSDDITGWSDYIYWSAGAADVRRFRTTWEDEPTLDGQIDCHFTQVGIKLYACGHEGIWEKTGTGSWRRTFTPPGAYIMGDAISVGGDGVLYATARDVNSLVYYSLGDGAWTLHSAAAASFRSASALDDGTLYAGTGSCEFWVYTVDYAVTPIGGGVYNQAMDCDGDGNALYICVYNAAAQPVLVKALLPLQAAVLGAGVFDPLDGDAINVQCANVGGRLAISGNFAAAGNEHVETSEDGANTWADVDRDVWGVDTAQPLLLDPDGVDEILIALATAQDLWETFDHGDSPWVQQNAAIGYSPNAMARRADGDEVIVGDGAAAQIDYSPNRGTTLNNITDSFLGWVAALEVV